MGRSQRSVASLTRGPVPPAKNNRKSNHVGFSRCVRVCVSVSVSMSMSMSVSVSVSVREHI